MKKKSKITKNKVQPLELITFIVAAFYMQSVLTVAHQIAFRVAEDVGVVQNPSLILLIVGLVLVGYNYYKEGRMGLINTVSLTILVSASIFWLSGLQANF
jgi:hypothetical protein